MKVILFLLLLLGTLTPAKSVTSITESQIQGRLNIVNGYSAECVMHHFYTSTGWIKIEGEVGRNGIDGLYYKKKNGVIIEVLVAESKWNKSRLGKSGKNKLIKQMSKTWVLRTMKRLQKHKPLPEYKSITYLISHDQYRARLFRMFPRDKDKIQIQIYKIKNKGMNEYDIKIEQKLPAITMEQPRNSFEKRILDTYNQCRAQGLKKYLPIFSQKELDVLLLDNYLQKKDVLKVIRQRKAPNL